MQSAKAKYIATTKNFVTYELENPFLGMIYIPKDLRPVPEQVVVNLK
jgi:hypothetical protein